MHVNQGTTAAVLWSFANEHPVGANATRTDGGAREELTTEGNWAIKIQTKQFENISLGGFQVPFYGPLAEQLLGTTYYAFLVQNGLITQNDQFVSCFLPGAFPPYAFFLMFFPPPSFFLVAAVVAAASNRWTMATVDLTTRNGTQVPIVPRLIAEIVSVAGIGVVQTTLAAALP